MPGRASKYSAQYNSEMKVLLMDALLESEGAVNIDQLKQHSIRLTDMTTQKAARLMNELVAMGIALKSKDKASGRVVYRAYDNMVKEGYEIGPNRGYEYAERKISD